jgi:ribonuclease P protein component
MVRRCCRAVAVRAASVSLSSGGFTLPTVQSRSEALPKEKRLAKRREFLRVYETGRKLFSRYCVVFFAANDLPFSRVGVTVTKKLGKANVRNRLKRWTREAYRRQRGPLELDRNALDLVINVKPNAAAAEFRDYSSDLERVLGKIAAGDAR